MRRDALHTVVELRRIEERQTRLALAERLAQADLARSLVGSPPVDGPSRQELTSEDFLAQRAGSHMAWAVFGARLGRSQRADAEEAASRSVWVTTAADLRSAERFLARRAQRAKLEATRRAQRDMDEIAIVQWRRKGGEP